MQFLHVHGERVIKVVIWGRHILGRATVKCKAPEMEKNLEFSDYRKKANESRAVVLKFCFLNHLEGLSKHNFLGLKPRVCDSADLKWGLRI